MDFRNKYKRGRINHEEYEDQIKKLENHYKCKVEDVFSEENPHNYEQNNYRN